MFFKNIITKYFSTDLTDAKFDTISDINIKLPIKIGNLFILIDNKYNGKFSVSFYEKNKKGINIIDPSKHIMFNNQKYQDLFMDLIPPYNSMNFILYFDEINDMIKYMIRMNNLKSFL